MGKVSKHNRSGSTVSPLDTVKKKQTHLLHSDLTTPYEAISKSHDENIKIRTAIQSKVVIDMFLIRS